MNELLRIFPDMYKAILFKCPEGTVYPSDSLGYKSCFYGERVIFKNAVIHMNDSHHLSFEEIADILDNIFPSSSIG